MMFWEKKPFERGVRAGRVLGARMERRKVVEELKNMDISKVTDKGILVGLQVARDFIERNGR